MMMPLRVLCSLFLIGTAQLISASTIGNALILRESSDLDVGRLYAFDGDLGSGSVINWSFYAGNMESLPIAGNLITPVIIDKTNWSIVGVGTTRTVAGAGVYSFDFGLVSGIDIAGPNLTFGWYNGSSTTATTGSISFDRTGTSEGVRDFAELLFPVVGSAYTPRFDFTGPNNMTDDWLGGRIYSVQFDPDVPGTPEPATWSLMVGACAALTCLKRK